MWPYPQGTVDLVTFTEEILNGKLHFLCSEKWLTDERRGDLFPAGTILRDPHHRKSPSWAGFEPA